MTKIIQLIAVFSLAFRVLADETCERYGIIPIRQGEYIVQNNVWGATTRQCVSVPDATLARFTVSEAEHNASAVAAYPSIFRGCHWGTCTLDSGMPVLISRIATAPFTWSVTPAPTGNRSIAAEAWFSPRADSANGYDGGGELMIWIDAHGMSPSGRQVGTTSIGGVSWEVWYAEPGTGHDWQYIAYRHPTGVTSVGLDLNDFIKDAQSRGYLDPSWYLHGLEAGEEIMSGGVGFVTDAFSFTPAIWLQPAGVLVGTPNYGSALTPLYDEQSTDTPQTWTELDEAPGSMGVTFNRPTRVAGVRFYSNGQADYWNHITSYRVVGKQAGEWAAILPSRNATGPLPGWEAVLFPSGLYDGVKIEYSAVSYGAAPRVGELAFAVIGKVGQAVFCWPCLPGWGGWRATLR